MDYKPIILEALEVLRNKEAASPFKARAYAKVIKWPARSSGADSFL